MHFHPDATLPFAQLQGARATWNRKMPVMAAAMACELPFGPNNEASSAALLESLFGGEFEVKLEHDRLILGRVRWFERFPSANRRYGADRCI